MSCKACQWDERLNRAILVVIPITTLGSYNLSLNWDGDLRMARNKRFWLLDGQNIAQLSTLCPFPGLGDQDLDNDTGEDDSPLPGDW